MVKTLGIAKKRDVSPESMDPELRIQISWKSYTTGIAILLLAYTMIRLWPLLQMVALGVLLAVALFPIVIRIQRLGLSNRSSKALVITLTLGSILLFCILVIPALISQIGVLSQSYPEVRDDLLKKLPATSGFKRYVEHVSDASSSAQVNHWWEQISWASGLALNSIWKFVLLIVISLYLLIDGERLYYWFIAFFPNRTQAKIEKTAVEGSTLIAAYVGGQLLTSALVGVFAFITLHFFGVPAALVLAIMASAFDVLPMIGFMLSAVPAVLMGLSVSISTGVGVAAAFSGYHLIENYYIAPRVYGNRMRLSAFAVLIALLAGWELAGIAGAILALPIAASYSVIERIWLSAYLHPRVIQEHVVQADEHFGKKEESNNP